MIEMIGVFSVVVLFLLLILGVPVFISLGLSAVVGFLFVQDPSQLLASFGEIVWQATQTYQLVAIPLFIFAGILMEKTGAAQDLLAVTKAWVGGMPNSMGVATVVACGIFAAISGSSIATAATIGVVAIPLLLKEGYSPSQAGGVVAGGGTLGIIIPPSIPLILYGIITETSIGKLFIAGVVPGIILLLLFAIYVSFSRPRILTHEPISWAEKKRLTVRGFGVLLMPIIIIGAIYLGYFTPTEVAGLSVLYVVILGAIERTLSFSSFIKAAQTTTRTTAMLLMLIIFAQYFAHFLTFEQLPAAIASWVTTHSTNLFVTITLMNIAYLILGTFLETAAMLLISVPIFFPIAESLGLDPVLFGIYVCISMEISQIHPPIGINLLTVHGISRISLWNLAKGVMPFLIIEFIMLYVIIFVPAVSLWLPGKMT